MLGKFNPADKKVTIIGAGISGLLIGYALKKKGYEVVLHEKTGRTGGLIQTKKTPYGIAETAAHSIQVNETVQEFLDEIGVELLTISPDSKARYIFRNGKMRRFPLGFIETLITLFHVFKKPKIKKPLDELNLEEWGNAYLGIPATRFLLEPFTTGIFACHPSELNVKLSFPKLLPDSSTVSLFSHFRNLRKKSPRSRHAMMVFKNGTEDLIQKLTHYLKKEIRFHSLIENPEFLDGNVVITVPDPNIRYSPLITVTAFYDQKSFSGRPPKGVGVLIPRNQNLRMLGCLFNSSAFSERTLSNECVSLTLMYGGTRDPEILQWSESNLENLITEEVGLLLKTRGKPLHLEITRWKKAIPIYSDSLSKHLQDLEKSLKFSPGKAFFSNYTGQVSIRGLIETLKTL